MIKKYIKGNDQRGAEVIKALEKLGGKNKTNFSGGFSNCFYYINEDNIIDLFNESSISGKLMQEFFEEIKLPEPSEPNFNVVIKEPKQIYWFRATEDDVKNQALLDKLTDITGIDRLHTKLSDGTMYYNPLTNSVIFCPYYCSTPIECTIAMMIGKELVIEQQ